MERGGRRGGGGGRRGKGRGGGRGGGGRGGGGGGYSREEAERNSNLNDIGDEFDEVVIQRNIKGDDEGEEYRQDDVEDDDDDDEDKPGQRMTTKFKWEEDNMEEEFNEAGERMEPFNLKGEREEGYFDKTGNFIWRKEEDRSDAWLGSLEHEEDMEAMIGEAAVAKRKREEAEAAAEEAPIDAEEVKTQAIQIMKRGETVLQALKRLGPKREQQGNKPGSGRASVLKTVDTRSPEEKAQFDQLTECADKLLRSGLVEIYELTYEDLRAQAARGSSANKKRPASAMVTSGGDEEVGGSSTVGPPKQVVRWQYKGADGQIHGPFSTADILQWRAQGFFTGPTAVAMRFYQQDDQVEEGGAKSDEPLSKSTKRVSFGPDVSFNADALAADFDDDDEEGGGGGGAGGNSGNAKQKGTGGSDKNPWIDSDSVNFTLYG